MPAIAPTCPRCRAPLFVAHAASQVELHGCGACGGVWLDMKSAQRVSDALPADALELAAQAAAHGHVGVDGGTSAGGCPVCGAAMLRQEVRAAAVVVDVCRAHGTWYDKDELGRVAAALAKAKAAFSPPAEPESRFAREPPPRAAPSSPPPSSSGVSASDVIDVVGGLVELLSIFE